MKILLISLPKDGEVKDTTTPEYLLYDFMKYPPLGLLAIAADVDSKHSLQVLDTAARNMTIEEIVDYIKDCQPDVLGISVVTKRLYSMYVISKKIKEILPNTQVVAGGPHINCFPTETMELGTLDYMLTGYGEKKFPQLIEAIDKGEDSLFEAIPGLYYKVEGRIKVNLPDSNPVNLDELPFPNRSLINLEDYFTAADKVKMTTMYSSRGCPYRCTFCDVQEKAFHYRSPKKIVDEFESIAALGIREVHIFDDTFNLNRQRVIDMCREILKRGINISWSARVRAYPFDREMVLLMKQAGCRRLHVGVEALDPYILEVIKKKITLEQIFDFFALSNKFKIDTLAYFILGFPQETEEYRKTLFKRIASLNPTYVYVNILYPIPKSEFYSDLLKKGIFKEDHWKNFIKNPVRDFELALCRSPELQDELKELCDKIHKKFYFSPRFIINDLRRTSSFKMLRLKAKIAMKLFLKTAFPH